MSLLAALLAAAAQQAGDADAWGFYRTITINNTGGAAHSNHQIRIPLTAGTFDFADARTDGYDIQFRATDGVTVLSSWREFHDDATDTAAYWVKVPTVPSNASTTIRMYYGNPAASDSSSITSVFLFGEDFRVTSTAALSVGAGSIAEQPQATLGNKEAWNLRIAMHDAGVAWRTTQVREQSQIQWTGSEFVMLVTGDVGTTQQQTGLYYADAITGPWTDYASNPVIPNAEDSYIVVNTDGTIYTDNSGWHFVYFERKNTGTSDIGVARTKNFRTDWEAWTGAAWGAVASHVAVLAKGSSGAWDDWFAYSPLVVHDGSQFVMLYEGAASASGPFQTGCARSADGITWTKEASNPILALEVVDDVKLVESTWWLIGHGDAGNQFRFETSVAPASWSSTSFTTTFASYFENSGNSIMFAHGFAGAENWATYQDGIGTDGIWLFSWLGGSKWRPNRVGTNSDYVKQRKALAYPVGVDDAGYLSLQHGAPTGTSSGAIGLVTAADLGVSSDFAVVLSKRQTELTADFWSTVAIGSGAISVAASVGYSCFANGYEFCVFEPDVAVAINRWSSGARTNLTQPNVMTDATASAFHRHEMAYLASGLCDYRLDGASIVSATNTAHLAATKSLYIGQGHSSVSSRWGGRTDVEWVAVRNYDGVDPTVTVGSEVAN